MGPWFSTDDRDFIELRAAGTDTKIVSPNERFHIENTAGNIILTGTYIGIGTTGPSQKLHVVGNAWINRPSNKVDNASCTEFGSRVEFNNAFASTQSGYTIFYYPTYNVFRIGADYDGNIGGVQPDLQLGRSPAIHIYNSGSYLGYVGIGTTTPTYKLEIGSGGIKIDGKSALTDNAYFVGSPSYGFRWNSSDDANNNVIMYNGGNTYFRTSLTINYNTSGQPGATTAARMWVHDGFSVFANGGTGDTSISTATSSSLLLGPKGTRSGTAGRYMAGISFDHLLSYTGAGTNTYSSVPHGWIGLRTVSFPGWETSALVFATRADTSGTAGTTYERMCISPEGSVGINTTSPSFKLNVVDVGANISSGNAISTSTMKGIMVENSNNNNESIGIWFRTGSNHLSGISAQRNDYTSTWGTDLRFYTHENSTVDLTYARQRMIITSEGAMGLGLTPTNTGGRFEASNDIVAYSSSDIRFKDNVTKIDNSLEKILRIRGVYFDWIEMEKFHGNKGRDVGVIAQEIEEILPEIVTTRENGYKAVKYERLVPLLIESIKDLNKKIEDQQILINSLLDKQN